MSAGKKIYFASDFHLGVPDYASSREREERVVAWLDMVKLDAAEVYLMGDIFDFWFEYAAVVPKGFVRLQGKIAELTDAGIQVTLFKGNHDMWMFTYFQQELGVKVVSDELIIERNGKTFFLHHGDGLGPGDVKYKFLKKIFRSRVCQWLFARLHPNFAIGLANRWSRSSRLANKAKEAFVGEDKEWLVAYAKGVLQEQHFDYFVFGHRHLPLDIRLNEQSRYVNLGEWMHYSSYAVFDGEDLHLMNP